MHGRKMYESDMNFYSIKLLDLSWIFFRLMKWERFKKDGNIHRERERSRKKWAFKGVKTVVNLVRMLMIETFMLLVHNVYTYVTNVFPLYYGYIQLFFFSFFFSILVADLYSSVCSMLSTSTCIFGDKSFVTFSISGSQLNVPCLCHIVYISFLFAVSPFLVIFFIFLSFSLLFPLLDFLPYINGYNSAIGCALCLTSQKGFV